MSFWTAERVEELKRLEADGLSASQIAAAMGAASRNAVISKLHQQGVWGRGRTRVRVRPASDGTPRRSREKRVSLNARALMPAPVEEPPPPADMRRVSLIELGSGVCRFPLGDPGKPGFAYCGASTGREDRSYCDYHHHIAHWPARAPQTGARRDAKTSRFNRFEL